MAVVFAKTRKGHEEIEKRGEKRGGGLTPRVRRVLIFIDGKRTVDDLRPLLTADDLMHTLGLLEEAGFIEAHAVQDKAGKTSPLTAGQALPSLNAFRSQHETDPTSLAKARNFMHNTINVFLGTVGTSTLLDRIQDAQSHGDLRALFDDWYHAIVSSRDGRREAEVLRGKLLEVI
jgi:hypothetical protein